MCRMLTNSYDDKVSQARQRYCGNIQLLAGRSLSLTDYLDIFKIITKHRKHLHHQQLHNHHHHHHHDELAALHPVHLAG